MYVHIDPFWKFSHIYGTAKVNITSTQSLRICMLLIHTANLAQKDRLRRSVLNFTLYNFHLVYIETNSLNTD